METESDAVPVVHVRRGDDAAHLALRVRELNKQVARLRLALDNCRLFASRSRSDEWAKTVLRFCTEGGSIPSPLRYEDEVDD